MASLVTKDVGSAARASPGSAFLTALTPFAALTPILSTSEIGMMPVFPIETVANFLSEVFFILSACTSRFFLAALRAVWIEFFSVLSA